MFELKQTETFRKWRLGLKDRRAAALIAARLDRLGFGHVGDAASVGEGVQELRLHYGPGYRIYFVQRGGSIIVLLCGGDKGSRSETSRARSAWHGSGERQMTEILTDYDPAEDLDTPEAITVFVNEALKTDDAAYIAHALGVVARAKGMAGIAREAGLSREQLYRTLSSEGNPTLKTTLAVMKALGISLTADVAG